MTAQVPNTWAIIDGLTNGNGYRFTVTARTADGTSGQASAQTAPVVPNRIAEPSDVLRGSAHKVSYDQDSLMIDGRRTFIYAGEMDPWRLPSPSLWLDRLQKMKAAGYNAVSPYFNWDYTSAAPGEYDFTGVRDMNTFLNMAQQVGLYVIARPGPYINAETDGGGIPSWLLTVPGGFRSTSPGYLSAALQWLSEIDPIIAAHQITRGGNVILDQVENEYGSDSVDAHKYMAALQQQARADGIDVPFTFNSNSGVSFSSGVGKVDISGQDNYPQGACTSPNNNFNPPGAYPSYSGEPTFVPEMQDGSWDGWGGSGFDSCYWSVASPAYDNVYFKQNIAQGVTMQSNYMAVGGTDWGWLPTNFVYSSYDYGAGIRETGVIGTPENPNDITGGKVGQTKLIGYFAQAVAPLAKTVPTTNGPTVTNAAVYAQTRTNPDDGTTFTYVRQQNASSNDTVQTHLHLSDSYPSVPQQPDTSLTITGRESKMLLSNYTFGAQHLAYSTSELLTQLTSGDRTLAVLYGHQNTDGETVLTYTSAPTVHVMAGDVTSQFNANTGDLRLNYQHNGLAEVSITGGGRGNLLLLIGTDSSAENFWVQQTDHGQVLVQGTYLIRSAELNGGTLRLTGDVAKSGDLRAWAPPKVNSVSFNGTTLSTTVNPDSSLTAHLTAPAAVQLPTLGNWRFSADDAAALPGYDDNGWVLADHPSTTSGATPPSGQPVLSADDYGFHHGFVWYRGHFNATGAETAVTLTGDGVAPTGAFSVWLNGAFLGSSSAGGQQTQTFTFPKRTLRPGADNVVAVLVEITGHQEGPSSEPVGLYQASLQGSSAAVTWRLQGNQGGTDLQDPTRGVMNPAGLTGGNNGWNLPGYPDNNWQQVSMPDSWSQRGVPAGIGWYRASFSLNLSKNVYQPIAVQVGDTGAAIGNRNERAFIYVNGWLIGQYADNLGPQQQFYVPDGILAEHGTNTLAIAVWGLDNQGGGLPAISLASVANQSGGVRVQPVTAPGYDEQTYGRPAAVQPTTSLTNSRELATGGTTFTTTVTIDNPTSKALTGAETALSIPDGWTVTPTGVQSLGTVAPGSTATARFTVTAARTVPAGTQTLVANTTYHATGAAQESSLAAASVLAPYPDLAASYDNASTTSNADRNPGGNFIGFDGGGSSYSAEDLAAQGITPGATVDVGGFHYTWPQAQPGQPDNTMAQGQTIAISGQGSRLGFILATDDSPLSGTGTVYYTDGSSGTFTLGSGNFWFPSGSQGNPTQTQVTPAGANYTDGTANHTVYIFHTSVAINPSKTVLAVRLPSLGSVVGKHPALHIWTMSIGSAAPSLASSFNNVGVTADANPAPSAGFLGFDDSGTTFSAEDLAKAGLTPGAQVTADGLPYSWPSAQPGQPDNTVAEGQLVTITGQGSKLGFILSANNAVVSGQGTVHYTDGTSSTFDLTSESFWGPGGPTLTQVASADANYPTGPANHTVYVYATAVSIDPTKTVAAVELPALNRISGHSAALHVFAMTIGTPAG